MYLDNSGGSAGQRWGSLNLTTVVDGGEKTSKSNRITLMSYRGNSYAVFSRDTELLKNADGDNMRNTFIVLPATISVVPLASTHQWKKESEEDGLAVWALRRPYMNDRESRETSHETLILIDSTIYRSNAGWLDDMATLDVEEYNRKRDYYDFRANVLGHDVAQLKEVSSHLIAK